ncbi:MAG: branched-chain amino acid transport system permease protein, partial [Solirubrobacteraceae bacterium]|nr:branched-chain amino acid transport system permease protein [Solirubrobacteraceae bacterium]
VAFLLNDIGLVVWGGDTFTVPVPEALRGAIRMGPLFYPKYRLFVLALGILVFILLWLLINKTRLGPSSGGAPSFRRSSPGPPFARGPGPTGSPRTRSPP